jgi:hypothetical protein
MAPGTFTMSRPIAPRRRDRDARPDPHHLLAIAGVLLLAACGAERRDQPRGAGDSTIAVGDSAGTTPAAPVRDTADVRVEVDIAARQVRVLAAAGDTITVHPAAVGSAEWPTRPGTWTIDQVVLNPEWTPPDESWAEEREPRKPGDPKNPLGRAQLVYDLPRTIHGTNDPASVGKAVSHGSVRVTNDVAVSLARLMLERTGYAAIDSVMQRAGRDSTAKVVVDLPKSVPIRVF